jgi:hypothetical protein
MLLDSKTTLRDLFDHARREDIIVQLADGETFFVTAIDSADDELLHTRKQTALMSLLDERAQEPATVDLAMLKAELGLQ